MLLVIWNNTKENFLWEAQESECQISENYILHVKFSEFYLLFTILVKFVIHFLGLPWEIFFGVTTGD